MKTPPLLSVDETLIKKIPAKTAARWRVLPLNQTGGRIVVATSDPDNFETRENLQTLFGAPIDLRPVSDEELDEALKTHFGLGAEAVSDTSMVRFVNDLIAQAARDRATDIHLEPYEDDLWVRFRVDGMLRRVPVPAGLGTLMPLVVSRIKVMAQMNIAEKRLPQDGRIRVRTGDGEMDIRVSTIPTIHGESVDLRLLPRERLVLGLAELGMAKDQLDVMEKLIRKPNGMILTTGPTGHGKTTTLYACLSQINTADKKIITIEDPVEYRLKGVNQIQAHSKIGLTFASGLRSVLRQDPDVIMVGEARDLETAEIAVRASLTGHLVLTTLHTNDAVGAITRLMDMGIEPYLVASSITAVVAQRLVRMCCPEFKGTNHENCSRCRGTGFSGRTGIFELLVIDDELRSLIAERACAGKIRNAAVAHGMRTLFEDGSLKARTGLTTLPEVLRVTEAY